LTKTAHLVLLKNSARSRPQGSVADKSSKWVREHCAVSDNDFQHAYALEKTNPNVGRELACICMALGRGEEAVRISREVLEKSTD
jgi:hypothetical protein